jgi:L-alanine-DL-glutamate epimerase-like enolase superfamily enzyme
VKLTWRPLPLPLRQTFTIAHRSIDARQNVLVELEAGGIVGRGEAEPTPYYDETAETALAALKAFDPAPLAGIEGGQPVAEIVIACAGQLGRNMSVLAALDAALWDIRGKQLGRPVWNLLGAPPRCRVPTSYTIGMADPDTMAREAERVRDTYRILKIKVGGESDVACLRAIRSVTDLPVRVDANAAWTGPEAVERIAELSEFGLELIEQPCPRADLDGLGRAAGSTELPVIADESCHTAADVDRLAGVVDGVNIKLTKSGGLCEAARIVERAKTHGLKLMIGCMTSSSLAVTAAAHVAGWMDFIDLDGNLLLAEDPFRGATVQGGMIRIPDAPGLGVEKGNGFAPEAHG